VSLDLAQRAADPELLDGCVPDAEALASLDDLRWVNRWLGGRRAFLAGVRPFLNGGGLLRLLDVGCGSADLAGWLLKREPGRVFAVGVDRRLLHLSAADPGVERVVADARSLPFAPSAFDVVTLNLFLHHFDPPELVPLLRALYPLARRALVVNDLHRACVPYAFARLVFPHVFGSRVSVADGLVSIRRGFRPHELSQAFGEAGCAPFRVRRLFPYRLLAVAWRPGVDARGLAGAAG